MFMELDQIQGTGSGLITAHDDRSYGHLMIRPGAMLRGVCSPG